MVEQFGGTVMVEKPGGTETVMVEKWNSNGGTEEQ